MKIALRIFTRTALQVVVYTVILTVLTELGIFVGQHLEFQRLTAEHKDWFTLVFMMSAMVFGSLYLALNIVSQRVKDRKISTILRILAMLVVLVILWSVLGHRPYRLITVTISGLIPILLWKSRKTIMKAPIANNDQANMFRDR